MFHRLVHFPLINVKPYKRQPGAKDDAGLSHCLRLIYGFKGVQLRRLPVACFERVFSQRHVVAARAAAA